MKELQASNEQTNKCTEMELFIVIIRAFSIQTPNSTQLSNNLIIFNSTRAFEYKHISWTTTQIF